MAYEKVKKGALKGHTLDIDPAVEQAIKSEETIEEKVAELQNIEAATQEEQSPLAQRWGNNRLTDATPGHLAFDPSYIPEYIELSDRSTRRISKHVYIRGQFRTLTADGHGFFCWSSRRKIKIRKAMGYKLAKWSELMEGSREIFEKGESDTIWNGDGVLMYVSLDGWERMRDRAVKLRSELEGAAGADFFRHASQANVPSFKDDLERGVREMMT